MKTARQLRAKDFLEELRAYSDAQLQLIAAECDGFGTDPAAREERKTRAHDDFRYFCRTYFPHYLKGAPEDESAFHAWLFDNVPQRISKPEGYLMNLSAPRGEAKSTLGGKLLAVWCVVTRRKHYMPYVMAAWEQAAAVIEAIKVELTENPRLLMDYPDETGRGIVWRAGVAITAKGVKLEAFGNNSRIRGITHGAYRPDLVFLDDLENDENVKQLAQRKKLEDWITSSVLNLGPPDGSMDVVYLNTILHFDSVANRFHKKPRWLRRKFQSVIRWPDRMDLWEQWEELYLNEASREGDPKEGHDDISATEAMEFYRQNKREMDRGAIVSWPAMRPLLRLMMLRAESHEAFDREQQNDPSNEDTAFFTNMQYWVHPDPHWLFHGVLDPSLGKMARKGDPAAILVGGFKRDVGKLSIVEAVVARLKPEKQLEKLIAFQRTYSCIVWGIEDTAFQEYFRQEIVKQSAAAGVPIPAIGIHNDRDKDILIEAVAPHANNGLILFKREHTVLNTQVKHWPEADHDDGPDGVQMLWRLCMERRGGIPRVLGGRRGQATRGQVPIGKRKS